MKDLLLAGLDVSSLYASDRVEQNNTSIIDFNGSENARSKSKNHFSIIRADKSFARRTYYNPLGYYLLQLVDTMISEKEIRYVVPGSGWDLSLEKWVVSEPLFGEAELIGTSIANFIRSRSIKRCSSEIIKQGLKVATTAISDEAIDGVSIVSSDLTFSSNPFSSSLQLAEELNSFPSNKQILNLGSLSTLKNHFFSLLYYVTEAHAECFIVSAYDYENRNSDLIIRRTLKSAKTIKSSDPLNEVFPLLKDLTLKLGWLGWGQVDLILNDTSAPQIVSLYPWPTALCHGIRWAGSDPLGWQIKALTNEQIEPFALKKEIYHSAIYSCKMPIYPISTEVELIEVHKSGALIPSNMVSIQYLSDF